MDSDLLNRQILQFLDPVNFDIYREWLLLDEVLRACELVLLFGFANLL